MEISLYQIDAFANQLFGGNPAAVCPLDDWLPDSLMLKIANENNLSETAFFVSQGTDFQIRWFTPAIEVDLCGHATLATAHLIFSELGSSQERINFHSKSGPLSVAKKDNNYIMNFPTDSLKKIDNIPKVLLEGLGILPTELYKGKDDYLAILPSEKNIIDLKPNFTKIAQLDARGLIVSARGLETDFVSRCFYPAAGINEDPVTGSAHTTMTPYWAKKLNKKLLTALQLSERGGQVQCEFLDDRVNLGGTAVTYLKGKIYL